jgi:hypothetical protein
MKIKPIHVALGAGALYLGYRMLKKDEPEQVPRTAQVYMPRASNFPNPIRDKARIEEKATEVWNARGASSGPAFQEAFEATRQTLTSLWPALPWPSSIEDQTPEPVDGAPDVFQQRWVNAAGAAGNAMKASWDIAARCFMFLADPAERATV